MFDRKAAPTTDDKPKKSDIGKIELDQITMRYSADNVLPMLGNTKYPIPDQCDVVFTSSATAIKYQYQQKLGSGSFGETFLFTPIDTHAAPLAIKFINSTEPTDSKHEARINKLVSGVGGFTADLETGVEIIMMKFEEGVQLTKLPELSWSQYLIFCANLIDTFIAMNNLIIHQDLGTQNILYSTETMKASIIDFGLSQLRRHTPKEDKWDRENLHRALSTAMPAAKETDSPLDLKIQTQAKEILKNTETPIAEVQKSFQLLSQLHKKGDYPAFSPKKSIEKNSDQTTPENNDSDNENENNNDPDQRNNFGPIG